MTRGRILIADDEPTFLESTADLLRREGYEVMTASDGQRALELVVDEQFDLLITDLEMPGNSDLALVRRVAQVRGGLPVIILTGFPSVRSAVASIELPVAAYLTKPVVFADLVVRVNAAVTRFRSFRAMQDAELRLNDMRLRYDQLATQRGPGAPTADTFLSLALRNVMGSLTDLEQLGRALAGSPVDAHACQIMNCPRGSQLTSAIQHTVEVLEETKHAFKSKQLAELRQRLELLLQYN
jgi:DNA-binding response OmpR family regulator